MGLKRRSGGPWWASLPFGALLAAAALGLPSGPVHAQAALSNCSQSVGASAAAVPFPASGATGPTQPNVYLEICNAHASQTLGVNAIAGGTAAIGSAGTVTLNPGGCLWWNQAPVPSTLSVIGSGGATTTACWYK
jgi:hypothetical protein